MEKMSMCAQRERTLTVGVSMTCLQFNKTQKENMWLLVGM